MHVMGSRLPRPAHLCSVCWAGPTPRRNTRLTHWNPPSLRLIIKLKRRSQLEPVHLFYFDKHLSDKYVLKRVQQLLSLVDDLTKNVDTALNAAFPLWTIRAEQQEYDVELADRTASDEKAVANLYLLTTARFCTPVASTLLLHPTASFSKWRSLLSWTQSASSSGYTIMDGQLSLTETYTGNEELSMPQGYYNRSSEEGSGGEGWT